MLYMKVYIDPLTSEESDESYGNIEINQYLDLNSAYLDVSDLIFIKIHF